MRRLRRNILITTAALVAAVVLYVTLTLPASVRHFGAAPPTTIYGAYHIHTNHSDGSGSLDDVAVAAADAALQFVIVTDHGDATRVPERPQYRHGVLVIDAVEISTISGHLVALGLNGPSPYRLGGEARDTVEDVHRQGGWVVAAHPDSPRAGLRWRGDDGAVDGIEWLNADSEWRNASAGRLLLAFGHYAFRPSESIVSIFGRPDTTLKRWDAQSHTRKMVGLAGVDAHAKIGIDEEREDVESRTILARPSYADMFRSVVQGIALADPLTGDGPRDAAAILAALRDGRTYSVVRALAEPGRIAFSATDGTRTVGMGESLDTTSDVTVSASVPASADARLVLFRDGGEVATGAGSVSYTHTGRAAAYRVEARLPGAAVPWIVTNAISVGAPISIASSVPPAVPSFVLRRLADMSAWVAEKHATSRADVRGDGGEVALSFRLAPGRLNGQYAAASYSLGGQENFESITATLRASAPMRVSVQVRQPGGVDGERWQRSVYVDQSPREVILGLNDFESAGVVTNAKPSASRVRSVMFVVDTWHTAPGTSGTVWISGVSIGQPASTVGVRSGR